MSEAGALAGGVLQLGQRVGTVVGGGVGLSLYYGTTRQASAAIDHAALRRGYVLCMASTVAFFALALVARVLDVRSAGRASVAVRPGNALD